MSPNSDSGQTPGHTPGLPGMSKDLRQTYDSLTRLGLSGPNSARTLEWISKQTKHGKHRLQGELRMLEGKGIVAHTRQGSQDAWYLRRANA